MNLYDAICDALQDARELLNGYGLAHDIDVDHVKDFQAGGEKTLSHYTTAEGLKGILETGKIWATEVGYLNDTTEIEHGKTLAFGSIRKLAEDPACPNEILHLNQEMFEQTFGNSYYKNIFVACFCEDGDLLSQWRAYGGMGNGFSIQVRPIKETPRYSLHPISYSDTPNKEHFLTIFNDFFAMFNNVRQFFPDAVLDEYARQEVIYHRFGSSVFKPEGLNKQGESLTLDDFVRLYVRTLKDHVRLMVAIFNRFFSRMKSPGFREEREWRIIHKKRLEASTEDIDFRVASGSLRPYVELPFLWDGEIETSYFEILSVTCGPNPHPQTTERSVKLLIGSLIDKAKKMVHLVFYRNMSR